MPSTMRVLLTERRIFNKYYWRWKGYRDRHKTFTHGFWKFNHCTTYLYVLLMQRTNSWTKSRQKSRSLKSFPPCYSQSPLPYHLSYSLRNSYRNLKSENSQDYTQKLEILCSWIQLQNKVQVQFSLIPFGSSLTGHKYVQHTSPILLKMK